MARTSIVGIDYKLAVPHSLDLEEVPIWYFMGKVGTLHANLVKPKIA